MRTTNRGSLTLGGFLLAIGLLFTVLAPGGLGEVTMVAGVAMVMAAFAPPGVIRRFGTRRALWAALGLVAVGAVLTIADWADDSPAWVEVVGGAFFVAGVLVLTMWATAPREGETRY
ncbi:hypothetical protein [uncultured Corynebacterium sp.]|uniref:hypothetical protein n=1 Tax=uncultured Corynebacterium sp. TaxID=159447 RepID=UPI0025EE737F|nr:hypothetical protein [uncultured Corynebacterium sp.]